MWNVQCQSLFLQTNSWVTAAKSGGSPWQEDSNAPAQSRTFFLPRCGPRSLGTSPENSFTVKGMSQTPCAILTDSRFYLIWLESHPRPLWSRRYRLIYRKRTKGAEEMTPWVWSLLYSHEVQIPSTQVNTGWTWQTSICAGEVETGSMEQESWLTSSTKELTVHVRPWFHVKVGERSRKTPRVTHTCWHVCLHTCEHPCTHNTHMGEREKRGVS